MFDEFYGELQWRQWHQVLTKPPNKQIDVALVKELYSNIYDPEDGTPTYYAPPPVVRRQPPPTSILMDQHSQMLQPIYQGQQIIAYGLCRLFIHLGMDPPLMIQRPSSSKLLGQEANPLLIEGVSPLRSKRLLRLELGMTSWQN